MIGRSNRRASPRWATHWGLTSSTEIRLVVIVRAVRRRAPGEQPALGDDVAYRIVHTDGASDGASDGAALSLVQHKLRQDHLRSPGACVEMRGTCSWIGDLPGSLQAQSPDSGNAPVFCMV